jgi:hypothetical protein
MRRFTPYFMVALATVAPTSAASAQERIDISFPIAEMQEAEERELERHRKRPGNFWCDPVDFDVNQILKLAEKVQSGEVEVHSSVIAVRIRDREPLEYHGTYSWVEEGGGVAEWSGRLAGSEDFDAGFIVVPARRRADAILDSEGGSFRLHTSLYSRIFILCEFDPNRLGRKID